MEQSLNRTCQHLCRRVWCDSGLCYVHVWLTCEGEQLVKMVDSFSADEVEYAAAARRCSKTTQGCLWKVSKLYLSLQDQTIHVCPAFIVVITCICRLSSWYIRCWMTTCLQTWKYQGINRKSGKHREKSCQGIRLFLTLRLGRHSVYCLVYCCRLPCVACFRDFCC